MAEPAPAGLSDEELFGAPEAPNGLTDEELFGQHQEMPGPLGALTSGLRHAGQEMQQSAAVAAHQPIPQFAPAGPEAESPQWADIGHPVSQLLPKVLYGLASGAPVLAAGVAGGAAGTLYAGPAGGVAGGAVAAGVAAAAQAVGPKMAAELLKTPEDVDGAFERALQQAGQEGIFSGLGWAAFGTISPFKTLLKNNLFQAFAIQPAVAEAQVATQNVQAGQPITQGMLEAYPGAVAGTLVPMLGTEGARLAAHGARRAFRGPEAAPGEPIEPGVQPPSPMSPEALQGAQATIERYRPPERTPAWRRLRDDITGREAPPEDANILPDQSSEAGMPSRAASADETGAAPINSSGEAPPSTQPLPGAQVSIRPEPFGISTTRETPPSIFEGPATTRFSDFSLGTTEPTSNKNILQGTNDYKALRDAAEENKPRVIDGLKRLIADVPGASFYGARVKDEPGLLEKIHAKGRPASTISDYLGARIVVDTPEAMQEVIRRLGATGGVIEAEDFIPTSKEGYRAYHMQVGLGDGTSAELQLVPRPINDVMEEAHAIRQPVKRLDLTKPDDLAKFKQTMADARALFDNNWEKAEAWHNYGVETGEHGQGVPGQWQGFNLTTEVRGGQSRKSVGPDGTPYETKYAADYGYFNAVPVGRDGEPPDFYMGPHPDSRTVYVIDELSQKTGKFKQTKSMLGFDSKEDALKAYLGTSTKSPKSVAAITALPADTFKRLLRTGGLGEPIAPRFGNAGLAIPPHRVTAADGTAIDVAPRVVELSDLVTSRSPDYDQTLQPRQREQRAAAQAQERDIATNLDPERLGFSAEADRGAPIVTPKMRGGRQAWEVDSGNGRIHALMLVYAKGGPQANAYRAWLAKQGVDVAAYRQPVLVRQRTTPLTPEARRAFTVAANQASTLAMSAPERAMADARMIDGRMLGLIRNPDDLASAGNRDFIRRFVASLPQSEQGMIADARGALSAEGLMRVRNALLAKAYDDPGILARIAESTDDEVKSISNALTAAAPAWAKLRGAISEGRVRPDMDATPFLLEAVKRTVDLRGKGEKLDAYLAQQDAFNKVPKPVEDIMRMFYDPKGRQAASARRISDALKFYAEEADKVSVDPGLGLGLVPLAPADILVKAKERHYEGYRTELPDRYGARNGPDAEAARRQERGSFLSAPGEGTAHPGDFGDQESAVSAQRPESKGIKGQWLKAYNEQQIMDAARSGKIPLDGRKVDAIADALRRGEAVPPPTLDAEGYIRDGMHRFAAQQEVNDEVRAQRPERLTGQLAFPGTEPISQAEVAKRRGAEPLRPKKPQLPPDMGLFGYEGTQPSLNLEGTNAPAAVRPDLGRPVGATAPQVLEGRAPRPPRKPAPVWRPPELPLFDWGGSGQPVRNPDVAVPAEPGGQEAPLPGTGTSVTSPPLGSGGDRPGPTDLPAPEAAGISEAQHKIEERSRSNYRITDADQIGIGGWKTKARANIEAIRVIKQIEDEARDATPEEKAVLVKYVGWGGIAQEMFDTNRWSPHRETWKNERDTIRALLDDEEYASATASTKNAHYTSPDVIRGMWDAMAHLGYDGGMALEPSAGIGHFIGLIPDAVAPKTAWTAVELDSITGRIAKKLYGGAEVAVQGFETLKRPSNYYDLAISNVPFGDYPISEKPYGTFPQIHNFFFVKSLDRVRPGGVVAFITSAGTMDRGGSTRRLLSKSADFLGAIRLPGGKEGAFKENANTEVTTDIVFLRKKVPGETFNGGAKWGDVKEIQTPEGSTKINEYFADNPHMMMGEMRLLGSQYRANEPVLVGHADGLRERIADAAKYMMAGAFLTRNTPPPPPIHANDIGDGIKDGSFFLKDGKLYQRREGAGHAHDLPPDQHDRVSRLVGLRDIYNDLIQAQLKPEAAKLSTNALRKLLRDAYNAFVKKYGPINKEVRTVTSKLNKEGEPVIIVKRPNMKEFKKDPDAYKVASIEDYNGETDTAKPADIQSKDVLRPKMERQISGPSDALAASLDDTGGVDIDHIAQSLNLRSQDDVVRALGDMVYQNPDGRKWETADNYLSGNVVKKLEEARAIAQEDASYLRNVSALEKVQPEPLVASQITAQFGAPWVPDDVYKAFLEDIGGHNVKVHRVPITGEIKLSALSFSRDAETKFGTDRKEVIEIANAAINNGQLTVRDKTGVDENGFPVYQTNAAKTEEARAKVELLKEAFTGNSEYGIEGWVWSDPERTERLEGIYNRTHNNLVDRKFDGSHLTLPGINPDFATRQHRKDAVWRVIQNGNTLFAHEVGSGKTATMQAAGMEQKRLGLISKPMYAVPNHMLEQFSREFIQTYPNAKLLVASKDQTKAADRKAFLAKVASNDWDGVIITHDAFGRINMGDDFRRNHIRDQLDQLERIIKAEQQADKKSPTVKALEKIKVKLKEKLAKLMAEGRKDPGTSFEESGVDFLFVDEAHLFKNLSFITRMQRIKGLAQGDSQRAEDLYLKMRYLEQSRPGRSAVFATGTPISNTMAELWTMQRYLQPDRLKEAGLDTFDAWANTFGQVVKRTELSADGRTYQDVSSFSKFVNVPELIALYAEIADTKTADMLNLPRPKVRTIVVPAQPSSQEEAKIEELVHLAESLKGKKPEKGQPNMLSVVTMGRKVATDGRLMSGDFDFNPQGKIAHTVGNIARIYHEGNKDPNAPDKAQMVFLDMGVPQTRGGKKPKRVEADDGEVVDPAAAETPRINLYADMKQRLVEAGIPAKEIAFIHDADNDIKKGQLFQRVNNGDVRVIVGSTGKMGVGTNAQRRLIALHDVDPPWKPAEVIQRRGRIERQGNLNPEVQIYRYVTERSFDAFMWQKLDTKANFVGQIQSGARGSRTMEDIDNPLPEAAEMKAAASGDLRIIEHAELDRKVRALASQRRAFEATKSRATWQVGQAKSRIQQYEEALPTAQADAAKVQDISGKNFQVDFGGKPIADRAAIGKAIIDQLLAMDQGSFYTPKVVQVGRMCGFDMQIQLRQQWAREGTHLRADLSLRGESAYASPNDTVINPQTDPAGLMRRFENILGNIKTQPERLQAQLEGERASLKKLEKTLTDTWPKEKDYRETLAKLNELTKALKAPKHPDVHDEEVKAERQRKPVGWDKAEPQDYGPRLGERVIQIGRQTVAHVSDRYTEAEQQIADAVHAIGKRMAPQANVAGVKSLRQGGEPIWGAFIDSPSFPHLIAWSLEKGGGGEHLNAYANTVRHEIVHHLKRAGLIHPDEWNALSNAAINDGWMDKHRINERYGDLSEAQKVEEAIAEQFGAWRFDREVLKGIKDPIRRVIMQAFQRMDLFFKQVAAAARQFMGRNATANDVFTRIESGEVGKRPKHRAHGGRVSAIKALPPDHKLGMRVPEGGSMCANCRFLSSDTTCGNERFVKWNGSATLPAPKDEYCCDLFEAHKGRADGGRTTGWIGRAQAKEAEDISTALGRTPDEQGASTYQPRGMYARRVMAENRGSRLPSIETDPNINNLTYSGERVPVERAAGGRVGNPKIDLTRDCRWMSELNSEGTVFYADRSLPRFIMNNGKRLEVIRPLLAHELAEYAQMKQHRSEAPDKVYREAHRNAGIPAERKYIEENGYDWNSWEAWCRGKLASLEKKKVTRPPPHPDVRPVPHGRGDLEFVRARADGGRTDDDLPVMVDPLAGKRSIGERPDVQQAIKDYGRAAAEPFGRVGRLITGQSQEPFQDAAMAAIGMASAAPVGSVLGRPLVGGAGYALSKGIRSLAKGVDPMPIMTARASGGRIMPHYVDPSPSEAQKASGNYRKHHLRIHGLDISIENVKGSVRSGVGKDGKPWRCVLPYHYGYVRGTEGKDGDHVDVLLGPHHQSRKVFVIDQKDADTGRFDEHKTAIGWGSAAQVRQAYLKGFSDGKGHQRLGHLREMDIDIFKRWLAYGDTAAPISQHGVPNGKDNQEGRETRR